MHIYVKNDESQYELKKMTTGITLIPKSFYDDNSM